MNQARMLAGFALYREPTPIVGDIIGTPTGCRLHRIIRLHSAWRLWVATKDFINGTYLELHDNGSVWNTTVRADEGDDTFQVRPSDKEIRNA